MPTYKYIITIIGGTHNGYTITKYTESDKNYFVQLIKENYDLDCNIEKISII